MCLTENDEEFNRILYKVEEDLLNRSPNANPDVTADSAVRPSMNKRKVQVVLEVLEGSNGVGSATTVWLVPGVYFH